MEPDHQEAARDIASQPVSPSPKMTPTPGAPTEYTPSSEVLPLSPDQIASDEVEPPIGYDHAPDTSTPLPPVAPMSSTPPESPTPLGSPIPPVPKKSRKKWIIGGVIAALLVVLIGGGASAYFLWYQNPQKVLTDGFVSLLSAKTSKTDTNISVKSSDGTIAVDIATQSTAKLGQVNIKANGKFQDTPVSLDASAIYQQSGDSYVKLDGLGKIVDQFASGVTLPQSVNDLVTMIDGKWIAISDSDLQSVSSEGKDAKACFESLQGKIANDKSYMDEISAAYRNHMFIEVKDKLGVKNGNIGYVVTGNEDMFIAFLKDVEGTKLYKAVLDCEKKSGADIPANFSLSDEAKKSLDESKSTGSNSDGTIQVWVSQLSHQLKETDISGSSDGTSVSIDTTFDPNANVSITVPSSTTSLSKVKTAINNVVQDFTSAYSSDTTDTTSSSLDQMAY